MEALVLIGWTLKGGVSCYSWVVHYTLIENYLSNKQSLGENLLSESPEGANDLGRELGECLIAPSYSSTFIIFGIIGFLSFLPNFLRNLRA